MISKLKKIGIIYILLGILVCVLKYDNYNIGEVLQIIIVGPLLYTVWLIALACLVIFQLLVSIVI